VKKLALILAVISLLFVSGCDEYNNEYVEYEYEIEEDVIEAETEDYHSVAETRDFTFDPDSLPADFPDYFSVRFYHSDPTASFWEYTPIVISQENIIDDIISQTAFPIDNFWYEETHLIVNLSAEVWQSNFLQGSAGAYFNTIGLVRTFVQFPNVETLEVLIGSESGTWGYHFSFENIFSAAEIRDRGMSYGD